VAKLEEQLVVVKGQVRRQDEAIEGKLKMVSNFWPQTCGNADFSFFTIILQTCFPKTEVINNIYY